VTGRFVLSLVAGALAVSAGCGSTDTKDDRPDPVVSRTPADPPASAAEKAPPLGKPRPKVPPSAATHETDLRRTESPYQDETPH
jgi:hypothetical protein